MRRKARPIPDPNNKQQDEIDRQEQRAWEQVDRVRERNADLDPADVLEEVTAEVEAVRQEMHDRRVAATKSRR